MKCFIILSALVAVALSAGLVTDNVHAPIGDLLPERFGYAGGDKRGYATPLTRYAAPIGDLLPERYGVASYGGYAAAPAYGPVAAAPAYGYAAKAPAYGYAAAAPAYGYAAAAPAYSAYGGYGNPAVYGKLLGVGQCAGAYEGYRPAANCAHYHQCSNGLDYLMPCPYGLNWSQKLLRCVYPSQSECGYGYAH